MGINEDIFLVVGPQNSFKPNGDPSLLWGYRTAEL
jgi:hypothetical protein